MADQIKEIFAGTATLPDLAVDGSKTLFTTDANTQYVIKDVLVDGVSWGQASLDINGFNTATLTSSVTGSEIVDVNSTVKYKAFNGAPTVEKLEFEAIQGYIGLNTPLKKVKVTDYLLNGTVASTQSFPDETISTNILSNAHEYAVNNNGDLFYVKWDGNSTTTLYKRIGLSGSQSTIMSGSYVWCVFDGVDKYYYSQYTGNYVYRYDINTGATTFQATNSTTSSSSYPSATMINNGNILFNWSGNSQTNEVTIYDPIANLRTDVPVYSVGVSGDSYKMIAYYNAATDRYTIYKRSSTTLLYKTQLTSPVVLGSSYSAANATTTSHNLPSNFSGSAPANLAYYEVDENRFISATHRATKTEKNIFDTGSGETTTEDWLPYFTMNDTIIKNQTSAALPSAIPGEAQIRVTGIKTTL